MTDFVSLPAISDTGDSCSTPPDVSGVPQQTPVTWTFIQEGVPQPSLKELTTIGVGGQSADYVEAETEEEFITAIRDADDAGTPLLVLGGGSNIVASDAGFDGVIVRDMRRGVNVVEASGCGGATVNVPAGQPWDHFVVEAITNGWMGVEALSGIPGTVGAAPVQNIGAYGQEVAETISTVTVWDRFTRSRRVFTVGEMGFGYRTSRIKQSLQNATSPGGACEASADTDSIPDVAGDSQSGDRDSHKRAAKESNKPTLGPTGRWVVLEVQFQMRFATLSRPVAYQQLADLLGVKLGTRVPSSDLRAAVLELRRSKGMVLDSNDPDTRSAGSFFTNPVLDESQASALPQNAPRYPVTDHTLITNISGKAPEIKGLVKTSAAWLIDNAGFHKGYSVHKNAPVALSTKHALALTNRGEATSEDVRELARTVRDGVRKKFGVTLVPEPVFIGISMD